MNPLALLIAAAVILVIVAWLSTSRLMRRRRAGGPAYVQALEAMAVGDNTAATRLLREVVEDDTDNIGAYLHLGRLLRMRGAYDRALRIHRELTVRRLHEDDRRRVLTEVLADHVQGGRWPDAKKVAMELRRMGNPDVALLRSLGKIHENLREWDEAIQVFDELEKRRPSPSDRRRALYRAFVALDFEKRGKVKEARRQYQSALKLEPSLPGAMLHLGDLQHADGETDKAIETWKAMIRQNPNAASLVFDRLEKATYDKDPGRITELAAEYERILAESPNDVSTMRALASLLRRRGDVEEALRVLDVALEAQPENLRLRTGRIMMLMETGQRDKAFGQVRDLLRSVIDAAEFTCRECGYRSEEYLWRCPACQCWETFQE